MVVTNDVVDAVLRRYLEINPRESATFASLLDSAAGDAPLTSRRTLPAHITCGAVACTEDGRLLEIHHVVLNRWLMPGGHVEPSDTSLLGAALRELAEETGIDPYSVIPEAITPVDVDIHLIPANPVKGEPEHTHVDFRYLFWVPTDAVGPLSDEVAGYRWVPFADVPAGLREKIDNARRRVHTAGTPT